MKKTEKIASVKPVVANGIEQVVITTVTGAVVWVKQSSFDDTKKAIVFDAKKAGDTWTNKATGETGELKADRNDFEGYSVEEDFSRMEKQFELMAKYGIKMAM